MGIIPAGTKLAPEAAGDQGLGQALGLTRSACSAIRPKSSQPISISPIMRSAGCFEAVEATGEVDNTLVFYIAGDNGTSGEGGENGMFNEYTYFNGVHEKVEDMLKVMDKWGSPDNLPAHGRPAGP